MEEKRSVKIGGEKYFLCKWPSVSGRQYFRFFMAFCKPLWELPEWKDEAERGPMMLKALLVEEHAETVLNMVIEGLEFQDVESARKFVCGLIPHDVALLCIHIMEFNFASQIEDMTQKATQPATPRVGMTRRYKR